MSGIDPAKLADWFGAQVPTLVLYARQWVDRARAEDVVQEVFVHLLAQRREPENVKAWLYVATRNAAIASARSEQRRTRREQAVVQRRAVEAPWFDPRPEDRIDARAAEEALATLPEAAREVVILRLWGGMTLSEVARVTESAISTVHDQYRNALARIRVALREQASAVRGGRRA